MANNDCDAEDCRKTFSTLRHMAFADAVESKLIMDKPELQSLEGQVDDLIAKAQRLMDENQALRDQQANLMSERATLIEKSELARSRVEAMIARLKAMEVGT